MYGRRCPRDGVGFSFLREKREGNRCILRRSYGTLFLVEAANPTLKGYNLRCAYGATFYCGAQKSMQLQSAK
jgi:hypothetical protein